MKISLLKFLCLFAAFVTFSACGNLIQDLETEYQNGRYLVVAELAGRGLQDAGLRPETQTFLKSYGENMFVQALAHAKEKGANLENDYAIQYLMTLEKQTLKLQRQNAAISNLDEKLSSIATLKQSIGERFVSYHEKRANLYIKEGYYRLSIDHFDHVLRYQPQNNKSRRNRLQALAKAKRTLSFTPFYKPADPLTHLITDTFRSMFSDGQHRDDVVEMPLYVENVDVPKAFTAALFTSVRKNPSPTLRIQLNTVQEDIQNAQYYLEGTIDATVIQNSKEILNSTEEDLAQYRARGATTFQSIPFTYNRIQNIYTIEIKLNAKLYLRDTDEKVGDFVVAKNGSKISQLHSRPLGIPNDAAEIIYPKAYLDRPRSTEPGNRNIAVRIAIQKAADQLLIDLKEIVDIDWDPYQETMGQTDL